MNAHFPVATPYVRRLLAKTPIETLRAWQDDPMTAFGLIQERAWRWVRSILTLSILLPLMFSQSWGTIAVALATSLAGACTCLYYFGIYLPGDSYRRWAKTHTPSSRYNVMTSDLALYLDTRPLLYRPDLLAQEDLNRLESTVPTVQAAPVPATRL